MAKKDLKQKKNSVEKAPSEPSNPRIKRSIIAIVLLAITVVIILGAFNAAGIAGHFLYHTVLKFLVGFGVVLVPIFLVVYAVNLLKNQPHEWSWVEYVSSSLLMISILGFIQIISPGIKGGGIIGYGIGTVMTKIFDVYAGATILGAIALISTLVLIDEELRMPDFLKNMFSKKDVSDDALMDEDFKLTKEQLNELPPAPIADPLLAGEGGRRQPPGEVVKAEVSEEPRIAKKEKVEDEFITANAVFSETYEYPPTSLLGQSSGKPSVGDIKANANLIKRTLLNFGIDVEMDEVSIGPTVTRYALKPAEGIKLTRILALKSDLALALAAHPIRIEAPIPGKSLVGIEIPNRTLENVGLGTLLDEDSFQNSPNRLQVALGKGVAGKSYFANLAKMPHLLIAGTTGSGKSVTMHNLILSLLYKNGPEDLRVIMIDPKRVELTLYNDIPHLLTPVIKESKKAILALKWAAKEMERRYDILENCSCRDIQSYHANIQDPYYAKAKKKGGVDEDMKAPERMPYIVVFIEELADIMQAYPRELEAGIVRLAQMSRAVGIHLILSTQRPSVNVITGLIKANIPSRLALQVASQIDSRTILDAPGAESLLGKGDMLYQGADMSKPERMQCANVDENQVKKVVAFIKKHNVSLPDEIALGEVLDDDRSIVSANFEGDEDDELYEDARACVIEAGKASTSYIQRKLKVGYSRAARLIDLLEERGVVGPADGAKPREVLDSGSSAPAGLSTEDVIDRLNEESEV
jgi:S-DNA-T family DNA segregation ATPase FtsK/SpoIIIE